MNLETYFWCLEGTYFWCSNLEEFRWAEEFYVKCGYTWSKGRTYYKLAEVLNFPIDIGCSIDIIECSHARLYVNHPKKALETMKRLNFKSLYLKQYFK